MVVVPRSSSFPNDSTQITSPKVATSTVVGLVLGILISYQLLSCPCKKRQTRRVRRSLPLVITTLNPPSKPQRSFRNCFGLVNSKQTPRSPPQKNPFTTCSEKRTKSDGAKGGENGLRSLYLTVTRHDTSAAQQATPADSSRAPTLRERRALRSLYLDTSLPSPRKRYPTSSASSPTSPALKRIGRIFQFEPSPGTPSSSSSPSPFLSPRTHKGRRHYHQLDDTLYSEWANEATYTQPPQDAFISPWSPNEGEFPYYPYSPGPKSLSEPHTPPPLYPPPPAYIPEIPLRAIRSNPETPTRSQAPYSPMSANPGSPISPIVATLRDEINGELESWEFGRVRAALATNAAGDDGVFVIAGDSEDGHSSSDLDPVSVHTDESMEPMSGTSMYSCLPVTSPFMYQDGVQLHISEQ